MHEVPVQSDSLIIELSTQKMANYDNVHFQFTANAVPHTSLVRSNENVTVDKFTQFTREELANTALECVDLKLEHDLDESGNPLPEDGDTTVGYIARTMKSDKQSAMIIGELPPIPPGERSTPQGQKKLKRRREVIEGIINHTLKDVSVAHKNEYTLIDSPADKDMKIMVEKCVQEVSLTKEGGRPGSSIIDYGVSNESLLPPGVKLHARPVCKSYVVVPDGDMDSIPQYVRANLKNFNISVDKEKGGSDVPPTNQPSASKVDTLQNQEMASTTVIASTPAQPPPSATQVPPTPTLQAPPGTQAVAAPAAPAPVAPVAQAAQPPLPVIPGSEGSSAYLATIQNQQALLNATNAELEVLRKYKAQFDAIQQRESEGLRADMVNSHKRFHDDTISVLKNSDEVKADPERLKEIAELEKNAETSTKIFSENLTLKMDEAATRQGKIEIDAADMLDYMRANQQLIQAFSKNGAKRRQVDLYQLQQQEIERAKAAANSYPIGYAATRSFNGSVPSIPAPQAAAAAVPAPAMQAAPAQQTQQAPPATVNGIRPVIDRMTFIQNMRQTLKKE
jgi:hypothetical protein